MRGSRECLGLFLFLDSTSKMPIDFSTYITQLNDVLAEENGPSLAYLLRPTSPHGKDLVKEFRNPTVLVQFLLPKELSYEDVAR